MSYQNYLQTSVNPPVSVTVTTALTAGQSGSLIVVPTAAAAVTITLPLVAGNAGCNYRILFTNTAALGNAVTVTAADATSIVGQLISSDGTAVGGGAMLLAGKKTSIIFGTTTNPGDTLSLYCDGTVWHATAYTAVHGAITLAP